MSALARHGLRERCVRPRRLAAPKGLRAGSIPDIHFLAGAGPYEVDVLLRIQPTDRIQMVGQITRSDHVHEPASGLTIVLFASEDMRRLASTQTDQFGEFELTGPRNAPCVLAMGEAHDAPCVLVWEGGANVATRQGPV